MREYGRAIQDCLSARAIWEPGESIRPGDYGQIENGCFIRLGSVLDMGIDPGQHQANEEGRYEFSRGLATEQAMSAAAKAEWTGEVISAIQWGGGAGLFMASPKSTLLTINDLGQVVRRSVQGGGWRFNWRLVRQVRILHKGVVLLGGSSASEGKLQLSAEAPLHGANVAAATKRTAEFSLMRQNVNGAVYANVVRLRPWLMHGAAPLDHELWYDDDFDDE